MEEKNLNKITFGTYAVIVTIVALVLLVGILAGMLIQKNKEDKRLQEDNKITTSQAENKVENTTSLKDNNKDITSNTKTTTETDKYKEITKELEEEELFLFEKYEENNGKITLRGVIAEPYIVSSSELKSIVSDGKLVLYGESYNVKKDDEGNYALYDKKFNVPQFSFIKKGNKYYLEGGGEYLQFGKKQLIIEK